MVRKTGKLGVRKGWESRIVVSKLGEKSGEYGIMHEVLNKRGSYLHDGETLRVGFYPITDKSGVPTSDKDDIRLYADDEKLDSIWESKEQWTLYPDDGAINLPYGGRLDGKEISIDYNFKEVIGYATGISWSCSTTLEAHHALGKRKPIGVTASVTEISGTVDQYYIDRVLFQQACKLVGGKLVPFDLEIIQGPESKNPLVLKFTNVRFGSWSLDFTQDGITANSSDFTAENINAYYL